MSSVALKKKKKNKVSFSSFGNDTKQELKKVDWPKKDVVIKATTLVLIMVIFLLVFIAGVDMLFAKLFLILGTFKF